MWPTARWGWGRGSPWFPRRSSHGVRLVTPVLSSTPAYACHSSSNCCECRSSANLACVKSPGRGRAETKHSSQNRSVSRQQTTVQPSIQLYTLEDMHNHFLNVRHFMFTSLEGVAGERKMHKLKSSSTKAHYYKKTVIRHLILFWCDCHQRYSYIVIITTELKGHGHNVFRILS